MKLHTSSDFFMHFWDWCNTERKCGNGFFFSFLDLAVHYSPNAGQMIGFDCLIMPLEIASNTRMLTMGRFTTERHPLAVLDESMYEF